MIASRRPSVPHRRLGWSLFFMVAVFVVSQGTSLPSQEPGDSVEGWTEDQVQEALGRPSMRDRQPGGAVVWYYDGTSRGTVRVYFINGQVARVTPPDSVRELWLKELERRNAGAATSGTAETVVQTANGSSLDKAIALSRAGRVREANAEFKRLVDSAPNNADYKVHWGRLLLGMHNPNDAVALFREALAIDSEHPEALLGLALAAATFYDTSQEAAQFAQRAIEGDPTLVEAYELLARLALRAGDVETAVMEADRALATSPVALGAMSVHATIDWLRGDNATPWIERILERDPSYGEAYNVAADFFVREGRHREATWFLRRAIELNPELWNAQVDLGRHLWHLAACV